MERSRQGVGAVFEKTSGHEDRFADLEALHWCLNIDHRGLSRRMFISSTCLNKAQSYTISRLLNAHTSSESYLLVAVLGINFDGREISLDDKYNIDRDGYTYVVFERENFNHLLFSCFDENITHHNIIYSNTDILEYYENSTRASRSNTGTARKSRSRNRRVRRDGRNTIRSWVGIVPITCLQCRPRTELLRLWVSPELRRSYREDSSQEYVVFECEARET